MPGRKPGAGSKDYFTRGHGHAPTRRVDQLAVDADVARAARAAGYESRIHRLFRRLPHRRDEVRGTQDTFSTGE
jgi:hypothetical protein